MHETTSTYLCLFYASFIILFTVASQCKGVTTAYQNLCYNQCISPVIREYEKSPRKIFFSNAYYLIPAMHLDLPFHRYVTHDLKGVPDIYSFSFHCEVYQHLVYSEEFNDIRT